MMNHKPTTSELQSSTRSKSSMMYHRFRRRRFYHVFLCSFLSLLYTEAFQRSLHGRRFGRAMKLRSTRVQEQPRTWDVQRSNNNNMAAVSDNRSRSRQKMKPMPITGYDAQAIEEFYDRRPLQVGWRLNSLGFPLLGG